MRGQISFLAPPPGLSPLVDFTLREIDGAAGLFVLEAVEKDGVRLFVLDAGTCLPDYTPVISDEQSAALGLGQPEDAVVLVVANAGPSGTTVNLMAPIVVNKSTGVCAQVILEGHDWPLQLPLGQRAA
ncbi:flagellar assembly protein FliW [Glaciibacter superstes]|uniref:flagellar assembly protein FliW n=1 Tax=Glaciibacter superstes TaxID=501023 RepID=UPI0003B31D2D|nr:flagellar assembly protein FliW [Glaciibacter superstes]